MKAAKRQKIWNKCLKFNTRTHMLKHRILSRYALHTWVDIHVCFPVLKLVY